MKICQNICFFFVISFSARASLSGSAPVFAKIGGGRRRRFVVGESLRSLRR